MSEQLEGWYLLDDIPGEGGGGREEEGGGRVTQHCTTSSRCVDYCVSTPPPCSVIITHQRLLSDCETYYWVA